MSEANPPKLSWWTRALASVCARCPVCRRARRPQQGACFELVKRVEQHACPFCRAYARVHRRAPHAPAPGS